MKLIDVLVQELPRRGGWPEGVEEIWQDYDRLMRPLGWFHDELCDDHRRQHHDAHVKISRKQYEAVLAASKTKWDGEGYPPVGCKFEYKASSGKWFTATMKYCGERFAIVNIEGSESWLTLDAPMRPIRSEEDKKRYAAIEALFEVLDAGVSTSQDSIDIYDAIAAGKIPHIRID